MTANEIVGDQGAEYTANEGERHSGEALNITSKQDNLNSGRILESGLLEFDSGIIQLEMFSGATLILQGPLKINLLDPMKAQFFHGSVRARVPKQAQGFTF